MTNLLFLSDEMMNPAMRKELRIPMQFVTWAKIEGKLYRHFRSESSFAMRNAKRAWGNNSIYGAIFSLSDPQFYYRLLDSYYICSLAMLRRNHAKDVHHRDITKATPIHFDTLTDLGKLKYREGELLNVYCYFGNPTHPKISRRLNKSHSYRITEGINKLHFIALHKEEG
jgi:hypothetical protein